MNLICDSRLAAHLTSASQKTRVITESWLGGNGYCLRCVSNRLSAAAANREACDFVCPQCEQSYELKSSLKFGTRKIVDGAYSAMMRRVRATDAPALMLLQYSASWEVRRLSAIHPVFLTPIVIEERAPALVKGKRLWIGCNILLHRVPEDAKIPLVIDGVVTNKAEVRRRFCNLQLFAELSPRERGWTGLVLAAVRRLKMPQFSLAQIYAFEAEFGEAYPNNRHIRDKARQQLQLLRDLGYLEFCGNGVYRILR